MNQPAPYAAGSPFEVQDTPEFRRVFDLRRREWSEEIQLDDLYKRMTQAFKMPGGEQELRLIQAAGLAEAHDLSGLFAPIRVGEGKAQPDSELVLLEKGWTAIGDVEAGDLIYGSEGVLHGVTGVYPQGVRPIYKVCFSDGTSVRCDIDHLWTFDVTHRKRRETKPLREWLEESLYRDTPAHRVSRLYLPMLSGPIQRDAQELPLDPYTLGALLGDGSLRGSTPGFTSMDDDIVSSLVLPEGVEVVSKKTQNCGKATDYALTKGTQAGRKSGKGSHSGKGQGAGGGGAENKLTTILRELRLMGCGSGKKFIPDIYMAGSVLQRTWLLQGLLDTDGEVAKTRSMFSSKSRVMALQVAELAESLGGTATLQHRSNHTRVGIQLPREINPFRCDRKRTLYARNQKYRQRGVYRTVTDIQYAGEEEATCISVSAPDQLYVTRNHVLTHNTLLTFLLPMVIPGIQRPTLLLPATLVEKTWREFKVLKQHWLCHPAYLTRSRFDECVITYEILGRDSGKDKLFERRPDLLMADECHKLRNREAACTKRVWRFMLANPATIFAAMSGTITKRSIRDYWHLAYWALKDKMPLPRVELEMEKWADAVDERKTDPMSRRDPGMLMLFCNDEERELAAPPRTAPVGRTQQMPTVFFREKLNVARSGYQRRLNASPGVISSPDENLDCSLLLRRLAVSPGSVAEDHLEVLRETWTTPNGDLLTMPMEVWRYAREIACGFYYRWIPPPPDHWMEARKTWNWNVRQFLTADGLYYQDGLTHQLDSPMQVGLAIHDGRITDESVLDAHQRWQDVKDDYKINTVAEWVDDSVLQYCSEWMRENKSGIVWTEHRAFGERLAMMLGTGFCSTGGEDAEGRPIEEYDGRPVVASVAANSEGRNLQAWNRNLIVTMSPTGYLSEQLIGRTHRMGQEADTVYVDWIAACEEQDRGFDQILADAQYIQDTTGQSQKVLYADRI